MMSPLNTHVFLDLTIVSVLHERQCNVIRFLLSLKFQSRSEFLCEKNAKHPGFSDKMESQLPLDKTVDVVLDSFDNLFCRRCLVHSTSGDISLSILFLMSVFCRFVQLNS
jgi:hypothetical protein